MAPPRLRLSNNNTHVEEEAPKAQLIPDLAGTRPTRLGAQPILDVGRPRPRAQPPLNRARLATALRSDGEGKAEQITLPAAGNRLRGDETAFAL